MLKEETDWVLFLPLRSAGLGAPMQLGSLESRWVAPSFPSLGFNEI